MDARTRELFRRWHSSGDEEVLDVLIRDLQRTKTSLTVLLSDNVQHYRGLLDPENFRSEEEDYDDEDDEEDDEEERDDVDRSTEVDYRNFILPPGAQRVAGIYLKHTLGYILNNDEWLELLRPTPPPTTRRGRKGERGNFKKLSSAAARDYLAGGYRHKKKAEPLAVSPSGTGEQIKRHLRVIAGRLMIWEPEYELVAHAILNYHPESVDPSLLADYQSFTAAQKALNVIVRKYSFHRYNINDNDILRAFKELVTDLDSFLFIGRGHTLWLEDIINNCNIIAANAGLTSDDLHHKCYADIVKAILSTDPNKVYTWYLTISVAPEQDALAEELARVRPILDTYPLEYPWSERALVARPEGATYEENMIDDDDYTGGPGYAFYTKYTGTVDALAEMRTSLVRDINTNRVDYMENTPWSVLSSLVSS